MDRWCTPSQRTWRFPHRHTERTHTCNVLTAFKYPHTHTRARPTEMEVKDINGITAERSNMHGMFCHVCHDPQQVQMPGKVQKKTTGKFEISGLDKMNEKFLHLVGGQTSPKRCELPSHGTKNQCHCNCSDVQIYLLLSAKT